jgi:hypothetical protein
MEFYLLWIVMMEIWKMETDVLQLVQYRLTILVRMALRLLLQNVVITNHLTWSLFKATKIYLQML